MVSASYQEYQVPQAKDDSLWMRADFQILCQMAGKVVFSEDLWWPERAFQLVYCSYCSLTGVLCPLMYSITIRMSCF